MLNRLRPEVEWTLTGSRMNCNRMLNELWRMLNGLPPDVEWTATGSRMDRDRMLLSGPEAHAARYNHMISSDKLAPDFGANFSSSLAGRTQV